MTKEERAQTFLEHFRGIAGVFDLDLTPLLLEGAVEEITGYSKEEFLSGRVGFFEIVHPDDCEKFHQRTEKLRSTCCNESTREFRIVGKDGKVRSLLELSRKLCGENGEPTEIHSTFHDISSRKSAEDFLREKNSEQELMLDTIEAQVWYLIDEETYGMVNKAHADYFGYEKRRIEYKNIFEFLSYNVANVCRAGNKKVFEKGETTYSEQWVPNAENEERLISITKSPKFDTKGHIKFVVCVGTDITERKRTEESLQSALDEKDDLMKELNHRVKNNLNMVSSLITLKDNDLGDTADLSDIRNQIEAIRIIHEKLYKSEEITHIDIEDYIKDILETIFSSFSSFEVSMEINVDSIAVNTKTAIPIGLITNEFATNAIKYGFTPNEATFTVDMKDSEEGRNYVLIISNTGKPFPEEVDIENPHTLGLSLINTLIEQLGGSMKITRRPHPVFTITIPKAGTI